mmetsp:Transcript_124867/g.399186  ORF Transcript_124867/g.399186 Transcript_124867/m.399186 type:complete len:123 (+) Transcript_124867:1840-2208(+)
MRHVGFLCWGLHEKRPDGTGGYCVGGDTPDAGASQTTSATNGGAARDSSGLLVSSDGACTRSGPTAQVARVLVATPRMQVGARRKAPRMEVQMVTLEACWFPLLGMARTGQSLNSRAGWIQS